MRDWNRLTKRSSYDCERLTPGHAACSFGALLRQKWAQLSGGSPFARWPAGLDLCGGRANRPTNSFTSKAPAIPPGSISAFMLPSKHLTIARLPPHFSTRHLGRNLAIEFGQRPLRAASSYLAALSPSQMGSKCSITARWHPNAAERVASASSRPRYGRGNWRGAFQDPMRRPSPLFRPAGHSRLPACRPLPRPFSGFPLSVLRPSNWHLFMSLGLE